MFVRVKTTPNSPRKSVQIVSSVRVDGNVKQKIVRHVGIAMDEEELARLKELAEVIKAKLETDHQPQLFPPDEVAQQILKAKAQPPKQESPLTVDLTHLREQQRVVLGIHEVYGELYQQLGFDRLLPASRYRASNEALYQTVMARIANPDSKRHSVALLEQDFGVNLPLEKVYRMMDQLDDSRVARLKARVCQQTQQVLGGQPLDLLFFDCTTLYFESFTEDDLKQNGYSKDCKFKQPQVLLALMVTREGLPVSYEVFPGATFEGHSLIPVIQEMRAQLPLERVICVADRGMLNRENLKALTEAGVDYIVGDKLKVRSQSQQDQILDRSAYQASGGEQSAKAQDIALTDSQRLIVSDCPVRAAKDRHDREQAVERLLKKVGKSQNPKVLLNNYGYKQFIDIQGKTTLVVNQEKVAQAARWDGLHGVVTTVSDLSANEVLAHYRGLWQVEESFRISKHDLKIRPIYHWTPRRVRAHLAIAFMAFSCVRHLMYRVKLQQRLMSAAVIRNALVHVQHSVLRHQETSVRYVIPSALNPEAQRLYRTMAVAYSEVPYRLD